MIKWPPNFDSKPQVSLSATLLERNLQEWWGVQIPVYIWAPEEEGQFQPGRCSRWWLHQSLSCFETDLQALGSGLVYRRAKESRAALIELVQETGAQALVFNHLYDPISLVRDNEVKTAMQEMQVRHPASRLASSRVELHATGNHAVVSQCAASKKAL